MPTIQPVTTGTNPLPPVRAKGVVAGRTVTDSAKANSATDGFAPSTAPAVSPQTPNVTLPNAVIGQGKPAAKFKAVMPAQNYFVNPPNWTPPVDFNILVPDAVKKLYPIFAAKPPEKGGEFNSRLETESKLALKVPQKQVDEFADKLEQLAKNPALVTQTFGEGWTLKRSDRYFEQKDVTGPDGKTQKQIVLDANGRPVARVMKDVIFDDDKLSLINTRSVLRFREFEGDKFNMVNFKPGFGRWDGLIISRIEYALLVAAGIKDHPEMMADFFESDEHLNFFRFAYQLAPGVNPRQLKPRLDIVDTRYRYILEHPASLTEVEISLDDVLGKSRSTVGPDGKPREGRFGQFEMEVFHTNMVGGAWDLSDPNQQQMANERVRWAKEHNLLPADGNFQPQIHLPDDVNNELLRTSDAYKRFTGAVSAMSTFMYGNTPPERGEQKARRVAELTGLIK